MIDNDLAKVRLHNLSDAIFALTLVMMISNIEVPALNSDADISDFTQIIVSNMTNFGIFLLTFVVIAIYWIKHLELFSAIKEVNKSLIWYQLIFMAFMLLLPITNLFVTLDSSNQIVLIVYSINLLAIGLMAWLSWRHLTLNPNQRFESIDQKTSSDIAQDSLVEPVVAALSIPAALISVVYWELCFILVPMAFALRKKYFKK